MIPRSSLSYISYFLSVSVNVFDMNATGCRSPLESSWVSTAPVATFDASDSIWNCQGFTSCTPVRVRDGSLPKGLNKYPAQLPRLRQLQTRVGSKSLVMQDYKWLPQLIMAPEFFGNLRREMSQVATRTFNVYITFLLYGLLGLTILDHIYSSFL